MNLPDPAFDLDGEPREIVAIERTATDTARALLAEAEALVVETQPDAERAAGFLAELVQRRTAVEEWFRPLVEAAYNAHRALTARRAMVLEEFAAPEKLARDKLATWKAAADAARKAAGAAAREQARRDAEAIQQARADAAFARGAEELAARILAAPPPVTVPVVAAEPTGKLNGVGFVETWRFEVVDAAALPREYLVPNEAAIRKVVSALKDLTHIPGVRVWAEQAVRTKKGGAR